MPYSQKVSYAPWPKRDVSSRPGWFLKKAGTALAAIIDAEWLATRYPQYELVPISLARMPATSSARYRDRVSVGLGPERPLMGRRRTD